MRAAGEVIVIGGGIIGCAIAREVASRGARVSILEGRAVASGATRASAGILAPYIEGHERGALFDLTLRSLALYDDFIARVTAEAAVDIDYRRCGSLEIAGDDAAADAFARAAAASGDALQWLPREDARRREPALPESIAGALFAPTHGYVAVAALTEALVWAALRHGAALETGRHVRAIERSDGRLNVIADDGATWTADHVVVATGSWSGEIASLDAPARAVRPIRGQLLELAWTGAPLSHVIWGRDCYVVPWRNGTILVGATVEDVGFDERTTAAGVRDLLNAVCELLPDAWRATFLDARAGLRPATSDELPIIGPSPAIDGVIYATGHFRNGILLAPLTAAIVADLILEGRRDPALAMTTPDRYRD
jgi:glycine oxidase